jgi:2-polyprenyl-6-methoxyphenol hydroxylase-like FAD-dependent oxidoreductase
MRTEGIGLLRDGDRVVGVTARSPDSPLEIRAGLVVATDGRHSTMRDAANLKVTDRGAPMDVLWLRLSRRDGDPGQTLGRIGAGHMLVTLDRGDYWQCAFVIAKGGFDALRDGGLEAFRAGIVRLAPHFRDRVQEIASWDDVKLLTVAVNRLERWYQPGLLLIGDAAHAMSPIGGVGINLAIQDAVAAANILVPHLRLGAVPLADLRAVQRRRELPTKLTQGMQLIIQNRVISNVLRATSTPRPPWQVRVLGRAPFLQRFLARIAGLGFRPEHVRPV